MSEQPDITSILQGQTNTIDLINDITKNSNDINTTMATYVDKNKNFREIIKSNLNDIFEKVGELSDKLSSEGFLKNKDEVARLTQELENTKTELLNKTTELTVIQTELETLGTGVNTSIKRITDLEEQKRKCEKQIEELNQQSTDKDKIIQKQDELTSQLTNIQQERDAANDELKRQSGELVDLSRNQQQIMEELQKISELITNQLNFIRQVSEVSDLYDYNTVIGDIKAKLQNTLDQIQDIPTAAPTTTTTTTTPEITLPDKVEDLMKLPDDIIERIDKITQGKMMQISSQVLSGNVAGAQMDYDNLKPRLGQLISQGKFGGRRHHRHSSSNKNKKPHKYGSVRQRRHRKKSTKRNRSHSGGYTYGAESAELQQSSSVVAETNPRKTRRRRSRKTSRTKTHSKKQ